MAKQVLVTGAGGFIGHHSVKYFARNGYWAQGADLKKPEYEASVANEIQSAALGQLPAPDPRDLGSRDR
jgi:nucleoside-diphosphate-sugar epimerase